MNMNTIWVRTQLVLSPEPNKGRKTSMQFHLQIKLKALNTRSWTFLRSICTIPTKLKFYSLFFLYNHCSQITLDWTLLPLTCGQEAQHHNVRCWAELLSPNSVQLQAWRVNKVQNESNNSSIFSGGLMFEPLINSRWTSQRQTPRVSLTFFLFFFLVQRL